MTELRRGWVDLPLSVGHAYSVRPAGGHGANTVLFIHENRGLVPYMLEVCDGLAANGFDVLAPDLLSRLGGSAAFAAQPDSVTTRRIDVETHLADLVNAFDWMATRQPVYAVVGFCFGAEMGWTLITRRSPARAALLYGVGPDPTLAPAIHARVWAVYAQDDERVNATFTDLAAALRYSSVQAVTVSYPGTRHAFHDRHRPDRFHPAAAAHVWAALLEFLGSE